jgi:hypothetical protein
MTAQAWYLIHSKPRQEDTALANLERQGFEAYLPRVRATVRKAGRYRERIVTWIFQKADASSPLDLGNTART